MQGNEPEDEARQNEADREQFDPLPPGPNYGPFGYFRLATMILVGVVAVLLIFKLL